MKVLWFVQKNFDPSKEKNGYNGAGWISSLRDQLIKHDNIELALAFFQMTHKADLHVELSIFLCQLPSCLWFKKSFCDVAEI